MTTSTHLSVVPEGSWTQLWSEFELALRAERTSEHTVRVYRDAGMQFETFLIHQGYSDHPTGVERRQIQAFLVSLRDRGFKDATVRARFAALKRFFGWLVLEEEIQASPVDKMRAPRVEQEPVNFVTDDEVRAMVGTCRGTDFLDRRDKAILLLLYDTGMRRGGLVSMTVEDTDIREHVARIQTKGDRTLVVPFVVTSAYAISRYLRTRGKHWGATRLTLPDGPHPLFLAQKGILTGDGVHQAIERRAKLAGIERSVWPHMFRHAFASNWKAAGGSEEDLMRLGGWRDSKSMRRYGSAAADARARDAHRRLSPADRL